jgi:hypothetical protein
VYALLLIHEGHEGHEGHEDETRLRKKSIATKTLRLGALGVLVVKLGAENLHGGVKATSGTISDIALEESRYDSH